MKKLLFVSFFCIGMFSTNQFLATNNVNQEEKELTQLTKQITTIKNAIQNYTNKINVLIPHANTSSDSGKRIRNNILYLEKVIIDDKNYLEKIETRVMYLQRKLHKPITPFSIS